MKQKNLKSRFDIYVLAIFACVFFIFADGAAAQTQFSELTKVNLKSGGSGTQFGLSVAVDGNTMISGAPGFSLTQSSYEGSAFVYVRNSNGAWVLQQQLVPNLLASNRNFGSCVGISGDTVIVGARLEQAVYIFVRSGTTWTQQARITGTGAGDSCAISGDTAMFATQPNTVNVFVRSGGVWALQTALQPIAGSVDVTFFGSALTLEGDTAVIGADSDNSARGSVQVFLRSGTTWAPQQRILASEGSSGWRFGASVALSGDTLIAGMPNSSGAGGQQDGSAFVFVRSGGVWTQQQKLISSSPRPQARFGTSVALENNTAIVGATFNDVLTGGGAAFVFQRSGTVWTSTQKLFPADTKIGDAFGFSVDLSNSNAVVGAAGDAIGSRESQGSAYIFASNPANCTFALSPIRSGLLPAAGGAGSFTVTTQAGCAWQATVQDNVAWVTTTDAGTGNGTVNFTVAANAGKPRRAEITINGYQVYTIGQAAGQAAQQGDVDQAFGNAGVMTSKVLQTNSTNGVAVQTDGKIVVVGGSYTFIPNATTEVAQVLRYNADGTLDATFDGDGIVTTAISGATLGNSSMFWDVVIQPDGKIVAAGSTSTGVDQDFAVVRYNANGSLDTTFGTGGIVKTDFGTSGDSASGIALAPDGKIVVSGSNANDVMVIARYNTNGALDPTFDGDGKLTLVGGRLREIALQADGKIVVVGSPEGSGATLVLRFDTNGTSDTTFDGDGRAEFNVIRNGNAIALLGDGKIFIGGNASDAGGRSDFGVARLNANGSLDTTFDGDGIAQVNFGYPAFGESYTTDSVNDIALQPNGKIIAVGYVQSNQFTGSAPTHTGIVRFNQNGSLDTTFGNGGKKTTADDGFQLLDVLDVSKAVALAPDGKIVVTGDYSLRVGQQDVMVLRFLGEGTVGRRSPFDFDGDGKTDISIFRPSAGEWWINRSSNSTGYALQFGASTDKIAPADYTGDGKTDVAFFRPSNGFWYILRSEDFSFYSFPFGASGDVPVPADYDGDGKADAAVFRESSLTWYINKSSGGTDIIGFGAAGDKPVVADYDGDGKADIAIFRPNGVSGAEWWVRRSSNASVFALQFGASTDKAVQGDYTGDGKADVAFWRPSTGFWFILRSEDFSFYSFPFGANGDVPVPGDYDGDGKTDAAVFRPSGSNWFVQRSTAGILIMTFGINGDRPLPNAFVP